MKGARALDFDYQQQMIYWSEGFISDHTRTISRMNISSSDVQVSVTMTEMTISRMNISSSDVQVSVTMTEMTISRMNISSSDVQVSVTMTEMRMNDREGKPYKNILYLYSKYFVRSHS